MTKSTRRTWRLPVGLLALSFIPIAVGTFRLSELASGATVTTKNTRFFSSPIPVVVHIISVTVFAVLGAFQFVPELRQLRRRWHRTAGRLVAPFGIAAALSGLWMALFYDIVPADDALLTTFRLTAGVGMVVCLSLGVAAIRTRDIARHHAWMMRGYAIGLGAGSQAFTNLPWVLIAGKPKGVTYALLMGAGWVINLALAE